MSGSGKEPNLNDCKDSYLIAKFRPGFPKDFSDIVYHP